MADGFFTEDELSGDEFSAIDELEQQEDKPVSKPESDPEPSNSDNAIPIKYRGKSVEEVIKMHQEAERWAQTQAEEVGFARKMAEAAAKRLESEGVTHSKRDEADADESSVEFFADPRKAVENAVSNHPAIQEAKQANESSRNERAKERVTKAIGDPQELMADPEFIPWLQQNPYRVQSLRHADANADADAAIEIFGNFKAYRDSKASENEHTKQELKQKTQSSKNAGIVDGGTSGEKQTGKIYRRADLIRLQNTDPDRYERLENEIIKAYSEGRVV